MAEHSRRLERELAATNKPWRVRIIMPTSDDPFNSVECSVVDVGHSDRVLKVESDMVSGMSRRIAELEEWKGVEQGFLIKLATRLAATGRTELKRDDMVQSVEWLIKRIAELEAERESVVSILNASFRRALHAESDSMERISHLVEMLLTDSE